MVLGASFDSVEANARFAEKQSFPFKLLCDTDQVLGAAYGVDGGKSAKRASFLIGPDGKIAKTYPKVSPQAHVGEVLEDLVELQE